jgi:hypothetical protein
LYGSACRFGQFAESVGGSQPGDAGADYADAGAARVLVRLVDV